MTRIARDKAELIPIPWPLVFVFIDCFRLRFRPGKV